MALLAAIASIAGTGLSVIGGIQQGKAAEQSAKFQALQMERNANAERAAGQQKAFSERDRAKQLLSRQQALAAASGGGAGFDAPSIVKIMTDTAGQGELNASMAQWSGEEHARGLEDQAAATRFTGRATRLGSIYGAIGSGLSGLGTVARGWENANPGGWQSYA